jgi:hypothetical protein
MTNDQIFAQHETLTSVVRSLVVRVDAVDARLLGDIMTELVDSFGLAPPVWAAAPAWQLLQTLMRGEGQEERSWQHQAADFNTQEVLMFLNALWDVYEATARAYFGASSSSTRA